MAKYDEGDGVWRTIGGRKVFIREGQSISSAMKESGKFKPATKGKSDKTKIDTDDKEGKRLAENTRQAKLEYEMAQDKYEHYRFDDSDRAKELRQEYNDAKDKYTKASREEGEYLAKGSSKEFAKQNGKIKVDPNDRDTLNKIADSYDNIDKYEGLDDISKDYIKNRRQEMSRQEFTNKANEIHEKSLQKAIENEKTTDSDKRYNTNETLENRVKRGIAGNQSDLVGKDREEQKAINKEYLKQAGDIAREKEYKAYYEKEKLGDPSNYKEGTRVQVKSDYNEKYNGKIVREATNDEKQNHMNVNLKGYIVRDENGNESVVPDTKIQERKRVPGTKMYFTDEEDAKHTMYDTILRDANRRYDKKEISREERNKIIDNAHDKLVKEKEETKISISDALRRKAYEKYLKEHPASKMKFEDFIK